VRWRLAAALVGIVALVLVVQDVPLAFHLERVERDRLETGLERDAYVLAGRAEDVLEGTTTAAQAGLDDVVADYRARTGATVVITDASGAAVATSGPGAAVGDSYANRPEIEAALGGRFVAGERESRTLGEPLVYVALPVRSGDSVLGAVRLAYPSSEPACERSPRQRPCRWRRRWSSPSPSRPPSPARYAACGRRPMRWLRVTWHRGQRRTPGRRRYALWQPRSTPWPPAPSR
jgi:hypothetical protein